MEQNNNNTRRVISLLVDNSNGVLARISSLFCRRGFNIDSLTVSATNCLLYTSPSPRDRG